MKKVIFFLFFLPYIAVSQLNIEFDKVVHDFGEIFEAGGEVIATFTIKSTHERNIHIEDLEASCGCMATLVDDPIIQPHSTNTISLKYNPEKRPGKFFKSAEIKLSDGIHTEHIFLGIKGNVIDDFNTVNPEENQIDSLAIPKFNTLVKTAWDTSWMETAQFSQWLNALTYELDMNNFAYLHVELDLYDVLNCNGFYWLKSTLRNRIEKEMENRGYNKTAVLYKFSCNEINTLPLYAYGSISLSSVKYSLDSIQQAYIKYSDPITDSISMKEKSFHSIGSKTNKLDNVLNDQLVTILPTINRKIMEGKAIINIQYTYPLVWSKSKAESHFEKKSKSFLKNLNKYLILSDSLEVKKTFSGFSGDTVGVYFSWEKIEKKKEEKILTLELEEAKIPYILSPVYVENMPEEAFKLDTQNKNLIQMLESIKIESQLNPGIIWQFHIQSVSDARPNKHYSDRSYLARKRGEKTAKEFKSFLHDSGLDSTKIDFINYYPWVRGMNNNSKYYHRSNIENNYITIVPAIKPDSITISLLPYKVNFDQNFLDIDRSSPFFNSFLDGLKNIINEQGKVVLIIESSSSKVPLKNAPSPEECSVIRGESVIGALRDGLNQRGICPDRMIIKEVNHVVSGPKYDGEYKPEKYQPYQYIKVIPVK